MDPERWGRIKELFEAARELESDSRATLLDRQCSGDPSLRAAVESLLNADLEAAERTTIVSPLGGTPGHDPTPAGTIENYRILGELGSGGMGVVYEAEQRHPKRSVALKVIRGGGFVSELQVKMFQREANTLARLEHPNIAAIYESGRTDDGRHFFAMELVRGKTLDDWLSTRPTVLGSAELHLRLNLFRKIADAVHYAHLRGVIHRDLKPSNIIVTEKETEDGVPEIKILDFGLARITDVDVTATQLSELGAIKGTLAYMSPEQTKGDPAILDVRADVYALGVILYELLAGRRPYDVDRMALVEAVRVICEEPARPLKQPSSATQRLDLDIETIVGKALEKEADRRYTSAAALSEDLARYMAFQPILARPPSRLYQLRMFTRRNRGLLSATSLIVLALAVGLVVASVMYVRARDSELSARRNGYLANIRAAEISLRSNDVREARARLAAADPELRAWEWGHLELRAHQAELEVTLPAIDWSGRYGLRFTNDGRGLVATAMRSPMTQVGSNSGDDEPPGLPIPSLGPVVYDIDLSGTIVSRQLEVTKHFRHSPNMGGLLYADPDGGHWIWETPAGDVVFLDETSSGAQPIALYSAKEGESPSSTGGFSADGSRLAFGIEDDTRLLDRIEIYDVATLERLTPLRPGSGMRLWAIRFSRDVRQIAAVLKPADQPARAHVWSLTDRNKQPLLIADTATPGNVRSGGLTFSPDGKLLAATVGDTSFAVEVWNLETGDLELSYPVDGMALAIAFAPDSRRLAVGERNGSVDLVSLDTTDVHDDTWSYIEGRRPNRLRRWFGGASAIFRLVFSGDGKSLAALDADGRIYVWDTMRDPVRSAYTLTLASSSSDPEVRSGSGPSSIVATPDGHIVAARENGTVVTADFFTGTVVHDTSDGKPFESPELGSAEVVSFDRAGRIAAAHRSGSEVWIRDARTGQLLNTVEVESDEEPTVRQALLSPDGDLLATVSGRGVVRLWDWRVGTYERLPDELSIHGNWWSIALSFTPKGERLAIAGRRAVSLWDLERHRWLQELRFPGESGYFVGSIAYGPGGRLLAASIRDPSRGLVAPSWLLIWDTGSGHLIYDGRSAEPVSQQRFVFSPDGSRFVVGSSALAGTHSLSVYETTDFGLLYSVELESDLYPKTFDPGGRHLLLSPLGGWTDTPFPIEVWHSDRD